jgi:hypothetical protein
MKRQEKTQSTITTRKCDIKGCDEPGIVSSGELCFCRIHGIELELLARLPDKKIRTIFIGGG